MNANSWPYCLSWVYTHNAEALLGIRSLLEEGAPNRSWGQRSPAKFLQIGNRLVPVGLRNTAAVDLCPQYSCIWAGLRGSFGGDHWKGRCKKKQEEGSEEKGGLWGLGTFPGLKSLIWMPKSDHWLPRGRVSEPRLSWESLGAIWDTETAFPKAVRCQLSSVHLYIGPTFTKNLAFT